MIAIKDMEMPKCCAECPMYNSDVDDYCDITGEWITGEEMVRHPDCPLLEIVTCKDCRHWNFNENSSILCGYCSNFETETNEDFYCMDGERRE